MHTIFKVIQVDILSILNEDIIYQLSQPKKESSGID